MYKAPIPQADKIMQKSFPDFLNNNNPTVINAMLTAYMVIIFMVSVIYGNIATAKNMILIKISTDAITPIDDLPMKFSMSNFFFDTCD